MSLIHPRNSLESLNMDSATRKKLKSEIEVYLTVSPNAQIKDICEFLESGTTSQLWGNLKKVPKTHFSQEMYKSFLVLNRLYSIGEETAGRKHQEEARIKRLAMNKHNRSLKVAGLTGVCSES